MLLGVEPFGPPNVGPGIAAPPNVGAPDVDPPNVELVGPPDVPVPPNVLLLAPSPLVLLVPEVSKLPNPDPAPPVVGPIPLAASGPPDMGVRLGNGTLPPAMAPSPGRGAGGSKGCGAGSSVPGAATPGTVLRPAVPKVGVPKAGVTKPGVPRPGVPRVGAPRVGAAPRPKMK